MALNKWIIIGACIVTAAVSSVGTAKITSMMKNKELARVEKIYEGQSNKQFELIGELAKMAKYSISNTWTIEKNKKGQMVFVPSNNMEVNDIIKSIDEKLKNFSPEDSIIVEPDTTTVVKTIWEKLKFWK